VASGAASFDFASADPAFQWDRVHVFAPYSDKQSVEKELGFRWSGFSRTTIEVLDGVALVVFVRNGKVVHWYEHPRGKGDLAYLDNNKGYARSESKFRIEGRKQSDGSVWVELKPHTTTTTSPATAG
jgi:hypothetical protein